MIDLSRTDFAHDFGMDTDLHRGLMVARLVYDARRMQEETKKERHEAPSNARKRLAKIERASRDLADALPDESAPLFAMLAMAWSERAAQGSPVSYHEKCLLEDIEAPETGWISDPDAPVSRPGAYTFGRTFTNPVFETFRLRHELRWLADSAAGLSAADAHFQSKASGAPPSPRRELIKQIVKALRSYASRSGEDPLATAELRVEVVRELLGAIGVSHLDLADDTIEHASR